jgi:hypothetical protein
MTLSTTQTKVSYIPDGIETRFAVPFPFFNSNDLRCKTMDADGEEQEIVNFSLEGMESAGGPHVRFFSAPAAGRTLVIYRNTLRVQESDYPEGGKFPSLVVEQDFDRLTGMLQEIDEGLQRAVKVPISGDVTPDDLVRQIFQAGTDAKYWAEASIRAADQAAQVVGSSMVTASAANTPRSLAERFADTVNVKDFGAKGDGKTDDTAAIQAACNTGKSVFLPAGRYRISAMLYLTAYGQKMSGAGVDQTTVFNNKNNQPLFLPGAPNAANMVAEFGALEHLTLEGNPTGQTLWGIFIPCAPYITATAHPSAVTEGWMPSHADNYYHGKLSFATTNWSVPARGFCVRNVRVQQVRGGYGVHASSWCWSLDDLQIYSGLRGIRIAGASNSCNAKNLYISNMEKEGLLSPNVAGSQPNNLMLINTVVQSCGTWEGGSAAIGLLKGVAIVMDGLYTEKNNLKGASRDIFVGVNAINTRLNNLYTTVGDEGPYPDWTVVETQGAGTVVGSIFQRDVVGCILRVSGSDSRTGTVLDNCRFSTLRGAPTQHIINAYTGSSLDDLLGSFCTNSYTGSYVSVHRDKQGIFTETGRMLIRNNSSTSNATEMHTYGNLSFCTQVQNAGSTAGRIRFFTNGDSASGTLLLQLLNTNGALLPGRDNTSTLGSSTARWSQVYAGTPSVNTSDLREKRDVTDPDEALFQAWKRVGFKLFRFNEAYASKGEKARIHVGFIAQDIQRAFADQGLDPARYGLFCHDSWDESPAQTETVRVEVAPAEYDDDGSVLQEAVFEDREVEIAPAQTGGERFGIRYSEALALEAACQRRRLEVLEERLAHLEAAGTR